MAIDMIKAQKINDMTVKLFSGQGFVAGGVGHGNVQTMQIRQEARTAETAR